MTLKLLGALLLATTVAGCGDYQHEDECTIYIDPTGLTEAELDIVVTSVEEWNTALDGLVEMHSVIGVPHAGAVFPHVIRAATEAEHHRLEGKAGNTAQHITIQLMMPNIHSGPAEAMMELKHTTMHELGHHLGLGHNGHEDSLMVSRPPDATNEVTCVTERDVASICQQFTGQCEGHDVHSTCEE